jgi:hypothetical protein
MTLCGGATKLDSGRQKALSLRVLLLVVTVEATRLSDVIFENMQPNYKAMKWYLYIGLKVTT